MATYTIFGATADGYTYSSGSTDYPTTVTGTGQGVDTAGTSLKIGQRFDGTIEIYLAGFAFDTSSIVDAEIVTTVTFSLNMTEAASSAYTANIRDFNWGTTLTTADWRTPSQLASYTLLASKSMPTSGTGVQTFTSTASFAGAINKTGTTYFIGSGSTHESQTAPGAGVYERTTFNSSNASGTSNDPKLVIATVAYQGSAAISFNNFTTSASGTQTHTGAASPSISNISASASGTQTVTGTASPSITNISASASGTASSADVTGTAAISFNNFTTSAQGYRDLIFIQNFSSAMTPFANMGLGESTSLTGGYLNIDTGASGYVGVYYSDNTYTPTREVTLKGNRWTGAGSPNYAHVKVWETVTPGWTKIVDNAIQNTTTPTAFSFTFNVPSNGELVIELVGGDPSSTAFFDDVVFYYEPTVVGTSAISFNDFTTSASGTQTFTGSAAPSFNNFVASASGTQETTGSAAPSFNNFVTSASGTQTVVGSSTVSINNITASASGAQEVTGSAAISFNNFTVSASGSETVGSAVVSFNNFVTSASGVQETTGTATGTVTINASATGTQTVTGSATGTVSFTVAASGLQETTGSAAVSFSNFVTSATGTQEVTGTASSNVIVNVAASGTQEVPGAASISFNNFVISASGTQETTGTVSGTVSINASASGVQETTGTASGTVNVVVDASGTQETTGSAAISFNNFVCDATGSFNNGVGGGAAIVFNNFVTDASGTQGVTGAASSTVEINASASGTQEVTGSASGTVTFTTNASGTQTVVGNAGVVLNNFVTNADGVHSTTGTASGTVTFVTSAEGTIGHTGSAGIQFNNFTVDAQGRAGVLLYTDVPDPDRTVTPSLENRLIGSGIEVRHTSTLPELRTVHVVLEDRGEMAAVEDRLVFSPAEKRRVPWA